ncbi:hypothetical protein RCL1_001939 [Eukaryota sp. TZLM3-RCL]
MTSNLPDFLNYTVLFSIDSLNVPGYIIRLPRCQDFVDSSDSETESLQKTSRKRANTVRHNPLAPFQPLPKRKYQQMLRQRLSEKSMSHQEVFDPFLVPTPSQDSVEKNPLPPHISLDVPASLTPLVKTEASHDGESSFKETLYSNSNSQDTDILEFVFGRS